MTAKEKDFSLTEKQALERGFALAFRAADARQVHRYALAMRLKGYTQSELVALIAPYPDSLHGVSVLAELIEQGEQLCASR
jgi:hypothetical protein